MHRHGIFLWSMAVCLLCLFGGCQAAEESLTTAVEKNERILTLTLTPVASETGTPISTHPSAPTSIPTVSPTVVPSPTVAPSPTPTEPPVKTVLTVSEFLTSIASDAGVLSSYDSKLSEDMTASAALLLNLTKQEPLYAYHVFDRLYPASITKLMTALLALEQGDLSETVSVRAEAIRPFYSGEEFSGAKLCGFPAESQMTMEELLTSMLVCSGNDAAAAVAAWISGAEEIFVAQMNERAATLGAIRTSYCNSHGMHQDAQVTTAYDTYLIINELVHYDKFLSIISNAAYTVSYQTKGKTVSKTFSTTNQYLKGTYLPPEGLSVLGGKTGTTKKAGSCLTLLVTDSKKELYVAEIFGAADMDALYREMNLLLDRIAAEE